MSKYNAPMIDDPTESEFVRELLEAGREFKVTDYDFEQGLIQHQAHVQAGTPAPDWASQVGPGAIGGALASMGATAWVVGPLLLAGLTAAVIFSMADVELSVVATPATQPEPVLAPVPLQGLPSAAEAPGALTTSEVVEKTPAVRPVVAPRRRGSKRATAPRTRVQGPAELAPAASPLGVTEAEPGLEALMRTAGVEGDGKETMASRALDRSRLEGTTVAARDTESDSTAAAPSEEADRRRSVAVRPDPPRRSDTSLEREMRMLAVAQAVLRSNPGRALSMARQGEREFGRTMFTAERRQVLLLALIKLGRMDEAKRLARPYLRKYPNGPFSDRIRRALVTGKVGD